MPNRLTVPEDLDKLIEKREQEERRKTKKSEAASRRGPAAQDRRHGKGRRKADRS